MLGDGRDTKTCLEALVLENPLDGRIFTRGRELGLEDDAETAIAYYLALGVLHLFRLAREAILHLLADYLCSRGQFNGSAAVRVSRESGRHTTHSETRKCRGPAVCSHSSVVDARRRWGVLLSRVGRASIEELVRGARVCGLEVRGRGCRVVFWW